MLTEIYIDTLMANEELADQVWEAWDKGEIDQHTAITRWGFIALAIAVD